MNNITSSLIFKMAINNMHVKCLKLCIYVIFLHHTMISLHRQASLEGGKEDFVNWHPVSPNTSLHLRL